MSRPVVFRRSARREYDEAVDWYKSERAGLGLEFKSAVDDMLAFIERQPALFHQVRGPGASGRAQALPLLDSFSQRARAHCRTRGLSRFARPPRNSGAVNRLFCDRKTFPVPK